MMTIFAVPVFDATVVIEGNELFKGQGAATGWAGRLAAEIDTQVVAKKSETAGHCVARWMGSIACGVSRATT